MSAVLTADMPHWLGLVFVALGVSAYAACGLLVLGARLRRRRRTTRETTNPRSVVLWAVDAKKEEVPSWSL